MPNYEVIVGNVGTTYHGEDENKARQEYHEYVEISKNNKGNRVYAEDVILMEDGEIIEEYVGHINYTTITVTITVNREDENQAIEALNQAIHDDDFPNCYRQPIQKRMATTNEVQDWLNSR